MLELDHEAALPMVAQGLALNPLSVNHGDGGVSLLTAPGHGLHTELLPNTF